MYIYPDNLKSKAMLWLWELRDIGIVGIGCLISVFALAQLGLILPIVFTAAYAFLSIRIEDTSILDFIRYALQFFVLRQQTYLDDKQVSRLEVAPDGLQGSRRLRSDDLQFDGEISEVNGALNFYLSCWFDVDEVFGTHVVTDENSDWLNVYANYSLADRQVCDTLDLILHREDSRDEELTYRLDDNEKAVLREKMDAYCTKETGLSLDDFCDSLMEMESTETLGLKM